MLKYKKLTLKNVVYYKNAELDLDYRGVTVIRGINKNTGENGSGQRSNASGKSLLVSSIVNCTHSSDPNITLGKSSSGAKRSMMGNKKASIEIEYTVGKKNFLVKKHNTGGVKYTVCVNGKDKKIRTASLAEKYIPQTLGLTEEDMYAYVYLDGRRPSVLQMGTATQRFKFISDLFRLHDHDTIKRMCETEMKTLKNEGIRLDMYKQERSSLEEELSAVNIDRIKDKLKKYQVSVGKLKKKSDKLYSMLDSHRLYSAHSHNRKLLKKAAKKFSLKYSDTESFCNKVLEKAESVLDDIKRYESQAKEYDRYKAELVQYKKQMAKIKARLSKIKYTGTLSSLEQKLSTLKKELDKKKGSVSESISTLSSLKEFTKDEQLEKKARSLPDSPVGELIAAIKSDISTWEKQSKHLQKHIKKGGNCKYCGSSITSSQAKEVVRGLKKRIQKKKTKIYKLEKLKSIESKWVKYREAKQEYLKNKETRRSLNKEVKEAKAWIAKKEKRVKKLEKVVSLLTLKKELTENKPEKVEKPRQGFEGKDTYTSYLNAASQYLDVVDKVVPVDNVEDIEKNYKETLRKYTDRNSKIPELTSIVTQYERTEEKKAKLEKKIKKLEKEVGDLELYKILVDAYSSKGIKNLVVQQLASLIESNMNLHSNLLFSEKYEFELKVAPNKFDILVHRHHEDGKVLSSDARRLSGAEGRSFNLLVLISILPLIPPSRRTNLVILDEMDANMDPVGMEDMFANQFIPTLNSIVPHVIVVTPYETEFPSSRIIYAVKKGNKAKLEVEK